ncbi:MAG: hypothetical protein CMJ49_00405 [Planctomycetaceae bacterium]|nr:hypothetical protein [Planctomycetaceae bacterium]
MKVLIVGGAGKVAGIMRDALEGAHDCYYYDRRAVAGRADRTTIADVNDEAKIDEAVSGMDSVMYLATGVEAGGYDDPELAMLVNVLGWFQFLRRGLELGVRHFVYASSMSVYIADGQPAKEETAPADCWEPYGLSKRLAEEVGQVAARHDDEAVILALRLVYPCTVEEWAGLPKRHGRRSWAQPIGPVDTGRLFLAALACRKRGAHVLNLRGDDGDGAYANGLARETIGWEPRGE